MTLEDYFLKTAASVLEQNKLAGIGDLLRSMKGFSGLGTALTSGGLSGAGAHMSDAYKALDSVARNKLIGQLAGGAAGAVGGYAATDDDAGILQHLSNMTVGAGMGGLGGGALAARLGKQPGVPKAVAENAKTTALAPAPAPSATPTTAGAAETVSGTPGTLAGETPTQPNVEPPPAVKAEPGAKNTGGKRRRAPAKKSSKKTRAR